MRRLERFVYCLVNLLVSDNETVFPSSVLADLAPCLPHPIAGFAAYLFVFRSFVPRYIPVS